jgi:hypothetical protein
MQDGVAAYLLQRWGADNFVYSNDYPHMGGIWPYTESTIEMTLKELSPAIQRKVLSGNLARCYGQTVPAPLPRAELVDYDESHWSRPWLKKAGQFSFDKSSMGLAP